MRTTRRSCRVIGLLLLPGLTTGCSRFFRRQVTTGVGAEVLVVSTSTPESRPSVVLESRRGLPSDERLGPVSRSSISFHDFETMRSIYDWYWRDEDPVDDLVRTVTFLPGFFAAPLAGSKMTRGWGMQYRRDGDPASPYIEGGVQSGLWLNLSDASVRADALVGGWAGLGMGLGDNLGMGMRTTVDQPVWATLSGASTAPIMGASIVFYSQRDRGPRGEDKPPPGPGEGPGEETEPGGAGEEGGAGG